jgi:ssDNA-binding replication factor A large subunit
MQSPKKFELTAEPSNSPTLTQISQISKMANFDLVNVEVKVSQVNPPCTVPTGKLKQDLIVADSTGTIKLTIWGNEVGKYEIDSSYQLQQMSIRTYNGYKYLNFPKEGGSSTKIGDIGDIAKITNKSQHTSSSDMYIHNARVCAWSL